MVRAHSRPSIRATSAPGASKVGRRATRGAHDRASTLNA
ncbi:hypothetical protein L842_4048 [Mycobacterium intracellulare MIN_052511_1280]|nr:hypothetical protein L842_4048 [Mycobacterium intracellulare MIN_052511_1280]